MKMGKLRLRRAKLLGQGLPASKTQSWGSNPGPSATGVLSHGSQLSCRKHGPSRPKRGDGPFGRYKWTTRLLALHPSGETFPWGGLASKGERQGPEPGALVPCPRHLQNLPAGPSTPPLPTRQESAGKGCMRSRTRAQRPPTSHPIIPLSVPNLLFACPAPTLSPGPSPLSAATRATSPKPHCQRGTYPEPGTTHTAG